MIKFNRDSTVTVTDPYWDKELTFSHREINDDEVLEAYLDTIMNHYWFNLGKNKRRYDG